ncbi:uncharacterized protein LOC135846515 isoform X2 [Planococcus citri]|uniref:uncharacterized protein LOC135846515 isoform X2 n=1 Tax=Planococcus citri TaxID=170843 RepID=UPI0031FA456A
MPCMKIICVSALKLTELRIDKHTVRGNTTLLECKFDLEGETLYAVKWYKDGNEFFRYLPKDSPQIQVFDVAGVHVDVKNSGASQVYLKSLELSSSGRYRCEVSGEAPSFTTVTEHNDMVTVALPDEGPKINGGKPRYHIGDTVDVNCTSGRSKPAASLHWFINGDQVNTTFLKGPFRKFMGREGLEATVLGLKFKVQPEHFRNGDMKLKCLATIATVYWRSNEESVEGEKQHKPPVMEIKKTEELEDDKSRADRVQASSGCRSKCNWHVLNYIPLLSFHALIVPIIAVR